MNLPFTESNEETSNVKCCAASNFELRNGNNTTDRRQYELTEYTIQIPYLNYLHKHIWILQVIHN